MLHFGKSMVFFIDIIESFQPLNSRLLTIMIVVKVILQSFWIASIE